MYRNTFKTDSGFMDLFTASIFSLIFFLGRLGDGGLRSDNILYAAISKSVLSSDNPLILNLGHDIYLNKPPLFFWINAFVINIFGCSVFSAKFASAMAAAVLAVLIFKIAKDIFGNVNAGYAGMLFFCFNYIVFKNSHACRPESLLALFLVSGFYLSSKYAANKNSFALIIAGIFFGLSVLIKGYIGILAFFCVILYLVINYKKFSGARLTADIIIFAVFFVSTFAWWYLYAAKNTHFVSIFFYKELMGRFINGGTLFRTDPPYLYLVKFIPYSALMLPFLIIGFRNNFSMFFNNTFISITSIFTFIYLIGIHFISTKYDRYLYPAMPLLCIISAGGFISLFRANLKPATMLLIAFFGLFFCLYPGKMGKHEFSDLSRIEKMATANGGQLCVDKTYAAYSVHAAGLGFFTNSYRTDKCGSKDIYINTSETPCDGYLVFKTDSFSACLRSVH